jgi:hypothetical protein
MTEGLRAAAVGVHAHGIWCKGEERPRNFYGSGCCPVKPRGRYLSVRLPVFPLPGTAQQLP